MVLSLPVLAVDGKGRRNQLRKQNKPGQGRRGRKAGGKRRLRDKWASSEFRVVGLLPLPCNGKGQLTHYQCDQNS